MVGLRVLRVRRATRGHPRGVPARVLRVGRRSLARKHGAALHEKKTKSSKDETARFTAGHQRENVNRNPYHPTRHPSWPTPPPPRLSSSLPSPSLATVAPSSTSTAWTSNRASGSGRRPKRTGLRTRLRSATPRRRRGSDGFGARRGRSLVCFPQSSGSFDATCIRRGDQKPGR